MNESELIIIGAGAAGLFAAGLCSSAGIKTSVFDCMSSPGRKLLITGQGRCNITNSSALTDFISRYGGKERFVRKCLYAWSPDNMISFLNSKGLKTVTRDSGKIFPESEKSRDVLKCLLGLCSKSYTNFNYDSRINSISHNKGIFKVRTETGSVCTAPKLILCAGGYTFPGTGSRGDGFRLAAALGHNIITPRPSLAALISVEDDFSGCAGISCEVRTSLFSQGTKSVKHRGALLFTHTGLSGPVIIDNSREMSGGDRIELNLLPDFTSDELTSEFINWCAANGGSRLKSFFTGRGLPDRLLDSVLARCGLDPAKKAAEVTKAKRAALITAFTALQFSIERLDGKKKAMCTAGGVHTAEINPSTMESRLIPGLYFAGEVIDVDGDSGGYNLQFAFSSAHAAYSNIKKALCLPL